MKARNIGIDAVAPRNECNDIKCAWHGSLSLRGNILQGKVVSTKARRTAVIKREFLHYLPKYERYERRHSKIHAYNPDCISAKEGNIVIVAECRPLSKTKHFVVIEKVGG